MNKTILKLLKDFNKHQRLMESFMKNGQFPTIDENAELTTDSVAKLISHGQREISPEVLTRDGERKWPAARYEMLKAGLLALGDNGVY